MNNLKLRALACAILIGSAGCAGNIPHDAGGGALPASLRPDGLLLRAGVTTPIKHVVIIIQENRTFDNFFHGFAGSDYADSGLLSNGHTRKLNPTSFTAADVCHVYHCAMVEYNNGGMNGFDHEAVARQPGIGTFTPKPTYVYSYVRQSLVQPYWTMAKQYVLADHMFPTEWGPSFTGHQDLIAGSTAINSTQSIVDIPSHSPWSCNAPTGPPPTGTVTSLIDIHKNYLAGAGPFPCFEYPTLADSLDAKQISWKYYYPYNSDIYPSSIWDAFGAIKKVRYGPDWSNVIFVPHQVLNDALAGNLPAVSWVIPDFFNSDHTSSGSDRGPSWVAAVVNSIGKGPDWNSTAIIVVWDDWGGWYDHVSPPQNSYYGLGFRVPCIIISPYAKKGYISHTQYEFGSVLKTVEQIFDLQSIDTTDVRSASMLDSFDFTQAPRPFVHIPSKYPRSYFITQTPSNLPVDND